MITHIVFFKLREFSVERAQEVRGRILAMREKIPVVRHLEAGVDVVRSGRSWDVALLARFDSREDLELYGKHPVHQEFVAWLSTLRESACVVDYESPEGPLPGLSVLDPLTRGSVLTLGSSRRPSSWMGLNQVDLGNLARHGRTMKRRVFFDPDGSASDYLGLIMLFPTGIVYEQQCGGVACDRRSAEGYFVPLGGLRFDPEEGRIDVAELTAPFHDDEGYCLWGGISDARLQQLQRVVESIPCWSCASDGTEHRAHLLLDPRRLGELIEAWVPVLTPDGPAILTWPNCD